MALDKEKKSSRLLASRRYTHDTYTDAQDAFTSTLDIQASEVYTQANLIPTNSLPFSGSSQHESTHTVDGEVVLKYYYRQRLVKSTTNNQVWFFCDPVSTANDIPSTSAQVITGSQQTNFISPKYSIPSLANSNVEAGTPGYGVKLFKTNHNTANSVSDSDLVSPNNYTFDYKTGIVQFSNMSVVPSNSERCWMSAYQYVGKTAATLLKSTQGEFAEFLGNISGSATSTGSFGKIISNTSGDVDQQISRLDTASSSFAPLVTYVNPTDGTLVDQSVRRHQTQVKFRELILGPWGNPSQDGTHANPNLVVSGSMKVLGDVLAERYIVSSSVSIITQSFSQGNTIFGDTLDDTHQFTGSLFTTGSIISNGFGVISSSAQLAAPISGAFTATSQSIANSRLLQSQSFQSRIASVEGGNVGGGSVGGTNTGDVSMGGLYDYATITGTQVLTLGQVNLSTDVTGSLGAIHLTNTTAATAISGAFTANSSSISTRLSEVEAGSTSKTLVSSSAQISDDISGSFIAPSSSFSTRVSSLENNSVFTAAGVSGSLGPNATDIRKLTIAGISGSLGSNATDIRKLTIAGISGSVTSLSASFESRVSSSQSDIGVLQATSVTLNGTQTLGNKTLNGPKITNNIDLRGGSKIVFEGATDDNFDTTLYVVDPDADRTINLPNASGTVSLVGNTETLLNKTLTSPVINNPVLTGAEFRESIKIKEAVVNGDQYIQISIPSDISTSPTITLPLPTPYGGDINANEFILTNNVQTLRNKTMESLTISGSIGGNISGSITSTGSFGTLRIIDISQPNIKIVSSSISTRLTTEEVNIDVLQTASQSLSTRVTSNESDISTLQNRTLTAGVGLSGGGNLTDNRTFNVDFSDSDLQSGISGSLGPNAATIRTLTKAGISGSLGSNATDIRKLTIVGISGSLGPNATDIRKLTIAGISGSFTPMSSSLSTRVTALKVDSGSFSTRLGELEGSEITEITAGVGLGGGGNAGNVTVDIDFSDSDLQSGISGSFTAPSSSFSTRINTLEGTGTVQGLGTSDKVTFNQVTGSSMKVTGNMKVDGTIFAQEFKTEFVSSSVIFSSGSTKFGDDIDDTHSFTGSLFISGSTTAKSFAGIFSGALSSSAQIADDISGSFIAPSSSFSTRVTTTETSITALQTDSQSFASRITTEEGNVDTLQAITLTAGTGLSGGGNLTDNRTFNIDFSDSDLQSGISGSLGSNAATIRTLTKAGITGSFTLASSSFSTRITAEEGNVDTLQARQILGGVGLKDGGDLTDDRTLNINFGDSTFQTGISGSFTALSSSLQSRVAAMEVNIDDDMPFAGDSGTGTIDFDTETFTIAGGTNATTVANTNTVTVNVDDAFLINSGDDTTSGTITAGGFTTTNTGSFGRVEMGGHIVPDATNTSDLGSPTYRWRNIYSADLQLSNENTEGNEIDGTKGSWTIQEGSDDLYLLNRKNGKKYKFKLEEIT